MNQLSEVAALLMDYCVADGRECPRGDQWMEFLDMLPEDLTKIGRERLPPMALILAAYECDAWQKQERVKEQIAWADAHGVIGQVDAYLRGLSADEWEYSGRYPIKDDFYDH